jgi:4-amino-4-deoxy-L-arabinose transferase-like glycosyltransferase
MKILRQQPILILLVINLFIGLMTFRSYGSSWDEPLFYDYGEALKYAYTPSNWFSGEFDVTKSFGSSGSDHANRGPAYLLVAMPFISFLKWLGLDSASAWHLVNFLTFNLGVYLLYRLASKWMKSESALAASALFAFQPLIWGHAFINPKDIPFLTFFLGSIVFGFEMVDARKSLYQPFDVAQGKLPIANLLLASFFLGIATSIRILAPFAGILVLLYAFVQGITLSNLLKRPLIWLYASLSLGFAFSVWPYLWLDPLQKFTEVFIFMSDNPTQLNVLFAGENYQAGEVPRRYFPTLFAFTLTEPTYLLIAFGILRSFWKSNNKQRLTLSILLTWFVILVAYILLRRPAMYDGYRHFLFILPPLFVFAGFAFEYLFDRLIQNWQRTAIAIFIFAFGFLPILQLHPYQYAYYNSFAGGVGGAFREYETEYWLTCYRESVLGLNQLAKPGAQLYVRREPYIAAYYADADITIRDFRTEQKDMKSGDYYLVNTRSNEDLKFLSDEPAVIEVSRLGATFCVIKQVP